MNKRSDEQPPLHLRRRLNKLNDAFASYVNAKRMVEAQRVFDEMSRLGYRPSSSGPKKKGF